MNNQTFYAAIVFLAIYPYIMGEVIIVLILLVILISQLRD